MRLNTPRAAALAALMLAAGLAPSALVAEKADKKDKKTDKKEAAPAPAAVATVDGAPITAEQLDAYAANQLAQLRAQEFAIRERALDDMIADRLVQKGAQARGLSTNEYLRAEVDAKINAITEDEKKAAYERFKGRLGGMSEADAMQRIEDSLRQQRTEERRQALIRELRGKASVRVLLEPPRVAVEVADEPVKGPAEAPVTIVEFSDFQCPYCARVKPTLERLSGRYGDRLRIVFRDFPLPIHKDAAKAAEAGACAHEQGKFWQMHDKLFADQSALGVDGLKKAAGDLGLDTEKFNQCLDSGKHTADWKHDVDAGQKYGVSGTPAFFINGRPLSGAVPYENFARIVDDELQRKGLPVPPEPAPPQPAVTQPAPAQPAPPPPPPPQPKSN